MASTFDAIVTGAGANGLIAAATLAHAGLRVLVVERAESVAGQSAPFEFADGFLAAPLGLDAGWVPPAVAALIEVPVERVYPDIPAAVLDGRGASLALARNSARAADAIRAHSPADSSQWPSFTGRMRKLAGFLERLYELPAPDVAPLSMREMLPMLGLARRFRGLGRRDMMELLRVLPMSVEQLADDWFESPLVRAAIAAAGVRDLRHGPRAGGTGFNLVHYMTGAPEGSFRDRGLYRAGPEAFAAAAEAAARRHGATIRTASPVAGIAVRDHTVTGVVLESGEELDAPLVLSATDPARTLLGMVDPVWLDPELLLALRNVRYRGCTAFVLYGLDALPDMNDADALLRGTVSLSPDVVSIERGSDAVKYGAVADAPHIEISAPSLHWPDHAPAGRHVLVARTHYAPYALREGTWDSTRSDALADTVTAAIDSVSPCFSSRITARATLSPADIESRYALMDSTPRDQAPPAQPDTRG
jgi:phytoene dehydrogenase-like protein